MSDLIRRDDLMKFPIRIHSYDKEHGKLDFVLGIETVFEYAELLPTVDAVEVVRCKNCRWFDSVGYTGRGYCKCNLMDIGQDDYCSYGERRSNAPD